MRREIIIFKSRRHAILIASKRWSKRTPEPAPHYRRRELKQLHLTQLKPGFLPPSTTLLLPEPPEASPCPAPGALLPLAHPRHPVAFALRFPCVWQACRARADAAIYGERVPAAAGSDSRDQGQQGPGTSSRDKQQGEPCTTA